jgi:hypothetical protein
MNAIVGMLGKVLLSMLMKLLAAQAIEDLVLFALKKLVDSTESKVDNELYAIVEKYMKDGK